MDLDPYKTPETEFEAKEGYHFVFKFGSRVIEAWGTGFSGKEYVTVDGELKSEKRTHAKTSIILNVMAIATKSSSRLKIFFQVY